MDGSICRLSYRPAWWSHLPLVTCQGSSPPWPPGQYTPPLLHSSCTPPPVSSAGTSARSGSSAFSASSDTSDCSYGSLQVEGSAAAGGVELSRKSGSWCHQRMPGCNMCHTQHYSPFKAKLSLQNHCYLNILCLSKYRSWTKTKQRYKIFHRQTKSCLWQKGQTNHNNQWLPCSLFKVAPRVRLINWWYYLREKKQTWQPKRLQIK